MTEQLPPHDSNKETACNYLVCAWEGDALPGEANAQAKDRPVDRPREMFLVPMTESQEARNLQVFACEAIQVAPEARAGTRPPGRERPTIDMFLAAAPMRPSPKNHPKQQ